MKSFKVSVLFLCTLALSASAQQLTPGSLLDQLRIKQDTTIIAFHQAVKHPSESFEFLDITSRFSYNSSYPRGFNDGPIWKGKGMTWELHGGLAGNKGVLSYHFQPALFYSQNLNFDLSNERINSLSEFAYQLTSQIDWTQRYGQNPFLSFHPGQSEVKITINNFFTSISTQNYSFGPSIFNPILLSQQGEGFPHIRIGNNPLSLGEKIGKLEVNFLAGLLKESNYFDSNRDNDRRYFNGLFFGFSPSFMKNINIGFGKVLYKQTRFFAAEDVLSTVYIFDSGVKDGDTISTNDTFDQLASISVEWRFPEVGFRAYGEFAKNDFTGNARWTLIEPEHSRGYTIGFEKNIITKRGKEVQLIYEHTNLSVNQAYLWRATPPFYSHGVNRQGYTNNGQLLGAGIGPGGNSDHFAIQIKNHDNNLFGLLIQRIENNRDFFVRNIQDLELHDIEYSLGGSLKKKLNGFYLVSEATISHNFNRNFMSDKTNLAIMIGTIIDF